MITCFLFFFSTFRLSAFALSWSSSAVHAGSCKTPSRTRAFALSRSSSAVHAGSCFASSRSQAFALSRFSSAVHAGSYFAPSRSRAFALSRSSSAVHAGSCHAPSRSRAFALSKTRKIQFCLQAANLDFSCFWHCSMLTDIIPHWRYFLIAVYRFLFSYYFLFCIIL